MFASDDTIVAIATPEGRGGIGVVRISGPQALIVGRRILRHAPALQPRHATCARVKADGPADRGADDVIVTWFPAPGSYTGEHVVEISAHGSPVVLRAIVAAAIHAGARLARPGEFTLRGFLNGKRDLVQSEAVADLIEAATPLQARAAFDQLDGTLTRRIAEVDATLFDLVARLEASIDFPDEGYHFIEPQAIGARLGETIARLDRLLADAERGRMIREGATVVLAGRTNVGKSSLFNALAGTDRAIVTDVPGTTRDLITERVDVAGLAVTLVDTAGHREARDLVEREGVSRGAQARRGADLVVVVLDASCPVTSEDEAVLASTASTRRLVAVNKCDLVTAAAGGGGASVAGDDGIRLSARTGEGLDDLRRAMVRSLTAADRLQESPAVSNQRHVGHLQAARRALTRAAVAVGGGQIPEEFLLVDLQAARQEFDEIVGRRTSADVLDRIFAHFCVGK
jgi:tRNA modification GTPase